MIQRIILLAVLSCSHSLYAKLIITAPHAHCLPIKERNCDTVSYKAAKLLAKSLYNPLTFFSTHYRADTDLNGEESRVTTFRQDVRAALTQCRAQRLSCLLIDVHSFPPSSYEYDKIIPDLYFIKAFYDNDLAEYLHKFMVKKKVNSALFDGAVKNDICLEATYNLVPSVIVEFNESSSDEKLEAVVVILTQAINSYIMGTREEVPAWWKRHIQELGMLLLAFFIIGTFIFYKLRI